MGQSMKKIIIEKLIAISKQKRRGMCGLIGTLASALYFAVIVPAILIILGKLIVAPYIPYSLAPITSSLIGIVSLALGFAIIAWAVVAQYDSENSLPAHNKTPQQLVVTGPYTYCRNPLLLGLVLWYLGLGILFDSLAVGIFCATIKLISGTFYHKCIEEKELELRFGNDYREYKKRVPFLIPRVRINN